MTSDSTDWDEDLPADPEEEYQDFVRTLKRKEGFGLLFVRCTPRESEQLIEKVKEDIPKKKIEVLRLKESIDNLYDIIEHLPNRDYINILFIKGLEYSLYEYEKDRLNDNSDRYSYSWKSVPRLLSHLNQQRERFRDNFKICFVFVLPLFSIKYFIHRAPDFFDWRSGLFELSQKYQDFLATQLLLQENHQAVTQKAKLLIHQGDILLSENEFEEAYDRYKQALELTSNDFHSWSNRGKALYELGNYEGAIDCYDKAIERKADFHEAWHNRGNALYKLGYYEESIFSYDKALDLKGDFYEAWSNRGNSLAKLGRYEEAVENYNKALKIQDDNPITWYNQGNALYELGRYEEAIASYDKALKIQPNYKDAQNQRRSVLDEKTRFSP
jgi:tetratricopeptide (TPR) repeat protein